MERKSRTKSETQSVPRETQSVPKGAYISDAPPDAIIIGGGRVLAFAELGALDHMDNTGLLKRVKRYVGVSTGAIIALLLAAGYTVREIIFMVVESNILEESHSYIEGVLAQAVKDRGEVENTPEIDLEALGFNLEALSLDFKEVPTEQARAQQDYEISPADTDAEEREIDLKFSLGLRQQSKPEPIPLDLDHIRVVLSKCLISKLGIVPSLGQLYLMTGSTLVCTVYDMEEMKSQYLSWGSEYGMTDVPKMSVIDAVMCSINTETLMRTEYHEACHDRAESIENGHLLVDAELHDPYPINLYEIDVSRCRIYGLYVNSGQVEILSSPYDAWQASLLHSLQYGNYKRSVKYSPPGCIHIFLDVTHNIAEPASMTDRAKLIVQGSNIAATILARHT